LGVPLSIAGLVAFGTFFSLTLFPQTMEHLVGPLALVAGLCGILLAGVQFLIIHQLCQLCLVVDGSAVMLAAIEVGFPKRCEVPLETSARRWAWVTLALVVALSPLAWASLRPSPPVPPQVVTTWLPGKINLVEITSFTCPYCRRTHGALESLRNEQGNRLHFVRFVATAPNSEKAIAAARAYLCAVRQNSGEIMADLLFENDDQSPEKMRALAADAGLDLTRFDADWKDPALDREIAATREWVKRERFVGVPQIWVQDILLVGQQSLQQLQAAVRRARLHPGE
jgi:protein-disulfide isomerase